MDKFESKITRSTSSATAIFTRFSSLQMLSYLPPDDRIESVEASEDRCSIRLKGYGAFDVQIIDREPVKMIKYGDVDGRPFPFTAWIQLVEVTPGDTRIRLTLHVKLPAMLRLMLKKKIQRGIDQVAERIAQMPL